jgi:hypothetical protein
MKIKIISLAGLFLLTSCDLFDVPEKTVEMAGTTQRMSETTDRMAQTTDGMSETTNDMANTTHRMQVNTDNMYHQIRTKEAQETRDRTFKGIDQAKTFEEKLTEAVAYHMGFEFQLWTNGKTDTDNEEFRKELMATATDEYFRKMATFTKKVELEEMSPSSKKNSEQNLFALAVTLHEAHGTQIQLVQKEGIEKITMLSMIKDSLKTNYLYEQRSVTADSFEDWMDGILLFENGNAGENRNYASGLLKLRVSMLSAMVLSKVSGVTDKPDFNILGIPGFVRRLRHVVSKWDSKFTKLNHVTQLEVNNWLEEALKTRNFLAELEMDSPINKTVKKAFTKMKKIKCNDCSKDLLESAEKFEAQLKILLAE